MAEINEIISKQALQSILDTDKALTGMDESMNKILKTITEGQKFLKENKVSFDNLTKAQKAAKKTTEELTKVEKQTIVVQEKINQLRTTEGKLLVKAKVELQQKTAATKREIQSNVALKGSYNQINAELNKNIQKYKQLSPEQLKTDKNSKKLLKSIQQQDKALKRLDAQMGRSQRQVGSYGRAISGSARSLVGAFGLIGGVALLAKVLKSSIQSIAKFEKSMSEVEAITNATSEQMQRLEKDALRLGASTKFTATEVAGLQVAYGRLGFTTKEILAATEATLDLAAATNEDLAKSAEVAGNTVRAFGFDASETQRVVDVMAASFSSTALTLEKFSTGMATVAPVAKSAGVSLERTTAILGSLANRGLDASTAGTALRNIFLRLAKSGLTWEEAMGKINVSTNKSKTALEIFGVRASTAALIIAGIEQETVDLTEALEDADGAAKKMADTMQDNLAGDVIRAQSAWEGFILSLNSGEGNISNFFRRITGAATNFISSLTLANKSITEIKKNVLETAQAEQQILDAKEFEDFVTKVGKEGEKLSELADRFLLVDITRLQSEVNDEQKRILTDRISNIKGFVKQRQIEEENAALKLATIGSELTDEEEKAAKKSLKRTEKLLAAKQKRTEAYLNAIAEDTTKEALNAIELDNEEFENWVDLQEEKLELAKKFAEAQTEKDKIEGEKRLENEAKLRAEGQQNALEIAGITGDAALAIFANRLEGETMALEIEKQQQLKLAGDDEERKEEIEEKFAAKQSEIRVKQAKADKLAALFNIAINTAQAIMKITAQTGVLAPLAIPLVIAAGVASAAVVLSQKIPQLEKGTKGKYDTPSTFIAGEAGTEILQTRSGKTQVIDRTTLFTNSSGMRVYSNPEVERIASMGQMGYDSQDIKAMHLGLHNDLKEVRKAILGKPTFIVDKNMNVFGVQKNKHTERQINKTRFGR